MLSCQSLSLVAKLHTARWAWIAAQSGNENLDGGAKRCSSNFPDLLEKFVVAQTEQALSSYIRAIPRRDTLYVPNSNGRGGWPHSGPHSALDTVHCALGSPGSARLLGNSTRSVPCIARASAHNKLCKHAQRGLNQINRTASRAFEHFRTLRCRSASAAMSSNSLFLWLHIRLYANHFKPP